MNPRMKLILITLGVVAATLLVSQFAMGLLIVRGNSGQPLPLGIPVAKLIKAHHHSGYATVTVALAYVILSLISIVRLPKRQVD